LLKFVHNTYRKLAKIAENCEHNIDPWSHCSHPSHLDRKASRQIFVEDDLNPVSNGGQQPLSRLLPPPPLSS
jgi:hypothetical protein